MKMQRRDFFFFRVPVALLRGTYSSVGYPQEAETTAPNVICGAGEMSAIYIHETSHILQEILGTKNSPAFSVGQIS